MFKELRLGLCLILTLLQLSGCNDIDDLKLEVSSDALSKLKSVGEIQIIRATELSFFDIRCENRNKLGSKGYYLLSSGTKMHQDFAKWACPSQMEFYSCPSMSLIPSDRFVLVKEIKGSPDDFSKADIEQCTNAAITYAETELKPTSEEAVNRASWES